MIHTFKPMNHFLRALIIVLLSTGSVSAQSIDFLPEGSWLVKYAYSRSDQNNIYQSGRSKDSIIERKLNKAGLDSGDISGSITQETLEQSITLQYGYSPSYNFALIVPYYTKIRNADSLFDKTGNNSAFIEAHQSASVSGMGDVELRFKNRWVYTDEHDLQVGMTYNHDNASYNYNDAKKLPLGTGCRELTMFLRWMIYAIESNLRTKLEYFEQITFDGKVNDSAGNEETIKRGNARKTSLSVYSHSAEWQYGGGVEIIDQSKTLIGEEDQEDGYLAHSYFFSLNFGNLNELEDGSVDLPWETGFYYKSVFAGSNAYDTTTLGITAVLYF